MSKHTPGPWAIENETDITGSENSPEIGCVGKVDIAHVYLRSVPGKTEAHARLIAAAPELLEALQCLFNSYKSLADSGDAGNWKIEDQPEGIKALAAIRKATGE